MVFVKGYWTERTLTVEDRLNILEQKVRELELHIQRLKEKQAINQIKQQLEELTRDFQGLIED